MAAASWAARKAAARLFVDADDGLLFDVAAGAADDGLEAGVADDGLLPAELMAPAVLRSVLPAEASCTCSMSPLGSDAGCDEAGAGDGSRRARVLAGLGLRFFFLGLGVAFAIGSGKYYVLRVTVVSLTPFIFSVSESGACFGAESSVSAE